jgi:hypothetical protein
MTTEVTQPAEPQPLTAVQRGYFDDLCRIERRVKADFDRAKAQYDDAKANTLDFIDKHGYVPNGAEKSKRCEGDVHVGTRTIGTSTEVDDARVVKFRLTLGRFGMAKFFHGLFEARMKYSRQKNADKILQAKQMPARRMNTLLAQFAQCFKLTDNSPSLTVETLAEVAERTAKAAKKSAKKAGR